MLDAIIMFVVFCFFKQKTAYEMRISDWSSDVCSSDLMFPKPYTRYTPALVPPPEEAEVCDEHYVFWSLAKRLGKSLAFMGTPLDMDRPPSDDEMLAIVAGGAPLPFDVIRNQPLGTFFDSEIGRAHV